MSENDVSKYEICSYVSVSSDQIIDIAEKPSVFNDSSRSAEIVRYILKLEIFNVLDEVEMVNGSIY